MFEKKNKRMLPIQSLIGTGMTIQGNICFKGGMRIDGEVLGNVYTTESDGSLLVISETGCVKGHVQVEHLVVSGKVEGPIDASKLLELHPSAKVSGDVRYKALEMHPGAVVEGKLSHEKTEEPEASKLSLASSNNTK